MGQIILITCVATIGGFLFGFDSGVINGTVEGLQRAFNSDTVGTGFNVASMLLGCAAGAFFCGQLADLIGRRMILILAGLFFLVSAWGSGIAGGTVEFVLYRVLGGLAVGGASVIAPAYISEVAPARIRGALSSVQQVAIIMGLTAAFLSNYLVARAAGSAISEFWFGYEAWRWMFWMEILPVVVFMFALLFIPESPRYLMLIGKVSEARKVLTQLFGRTAADETIREIEASLSADGCKPKLSDLVVKGSYNLRPIAWTGIGLAIFQQLVGINVVYYYGAALWQSVGYAESDALLINAISGSVSVAACLITVFLIDRVGRKPLLWIGSVGMTLTLAAMAIAFSTASLVDGALALSEQMGRVALISANAYVFMFNLSWGPVMWVMLGEMFPNQIRGSGLAVSGLVQWFANFGITMTFPILLTSIGLSGAYGLYTLFAALSVFFVLRMVTETKGRELEQMT